jgi:hypothetical protein
VSLSSIRLRHLSFFSTCLLTLSSGSFDSPFIPGSQVSIPQLRQNAPVSLSSPAWHRASVSSRCHPLIISIESTDIHFSKEEDKKPHINIVVIGHVDSGKSTTTGRKHSRSSRLYTLTRLQT